MRQGAVDLWATVMCGGRGEQVEKMEYDRGMLEGFIARTDGSIASEEVNDGQPQ